ncbi:MAG: alpha/beta hydrolase [Neomegalonema sp.]|nr:alpha/beta hydrolase [Neomegalonema sp.]
MTSSPAEQDDDFGVPAMTPWGAPEEQTLAFNRALRKLLAGLPPPEATDIPAARALRESGKGILPNDGPLPEGRWQEIEGASGRTEPAKLRMIDAPDGFDQAAGIYVHIHGGGWTFGSPEYADGRFLRLARAANVAVIGVKYRLAPENIWPAQADDCLAALQWVIANAKGKPIILGGESAGAHLAAVTLLRLREHALIEHIRAAVLTYGAFDMRGTPSTRNWGPRNLILSTPVVRWFAQNVLGDMALAQTPGASPLLADLGGLVPAFFQCGTEDPLLDDTLFMEARWRAAGLGTELKIWPGAVHAFDYFEHEKFNLPIAHESQALVSDYIKRMLA